MQLVLWHGVAVLHLVSLSTLDGTFRRVGLHGPKVVAVCDAREGLSRLHGIFSCRSVFNMIR